MVPDETLSSNKHISILIREIKGVKDTEHVLEAKTTVNNRGWELAVPDNGATPDGVLQNSLAQL